MNIYEVRYYMDCGMYMSHLYIRNVLANNEKEAKLKVYINKRKVRKWLCLIDIDFVNIELLEQNVDISLYDKETLEEEEKLLQEFRFNNDLDKAWFYGEGVAYY